MIFSRDKLNDKDLINTVDIQHDKKYSYEIIDLLKEKNFFPKTDENIIWILEIDEKEIGWYRQKLGSYSIKDYNIKDKEPLKIHFKLFKSFEERAEFIFKKCNGSKIKLLDYLFEYEDYKVSPELENIWTKELKKENKYEFVDVDLIIKEDCEKLKLILKRPGMFVGKNRLDYVELFYDGMRYLARDSTYNFRFWNLNYDLEKWLLLNESVSLSSRLSISYWSIFYRCFGNEKLAIENFRKFLDEAELNSIFNKKSFGYSVKDINWKFTFNEKELNDSINKYISFDENDLKRNKRYKYNILIKHIENIIGEDYKKIKIYLCNDYHFIHVRFFIQDKNNKWIDGISFNKDEAYYGKLSVIHGLVSLIINEGKSNIETITYNKNNNELNFTKNKLGEKVLNNGLFSNSDFSEDSSFYGQLEKWKVKNII